MKSNTEKIPSSFWLFPFIFALLMWVMYWIDEKYMLDLYTLGVYPRRISGLLGAVTAPFIHGSLSHLVSNTFPLLILGSGIGYFYHQTANKIYLIGWVASGLMVWFFGRETYHIGASGVVYALAFFIFFSGLFRGHPQLIALSLLVAFLYGSLVWGMLPVEEHISWESHLFGGIIGLSTAFIFRNSNPAHLRKHFWHKEEKIWDEAEEAALEELDYWKTDDQKTHVNHQTPAEDNTDTSYKDNHIRIVYKYRDKNE